MRTTIEISDELRAKLLGLAARRGMKGFSVLIEEALESYLGREASDSERLDKALAARGSLDEDDAEHLLRASVELRNTWR